MPTPIQILFTTLLGLALLFQGLHLRAEATDPMGVVPEEVRPSGSTGRAWGSVLMAYGGVLAALALGALFDPDFRPGVVPLRNGGIVLSVAFGFWVVFLNRKVAYLGQPAQDAGHGHH